MFEHLTEKLEVESEKINLNDFSAENTLSLRDLLLSKQRTAELLCKTEVPQEPDLIRQTSTQAALEVAGTSKPPSPVPKKRIQA